MLSRAQVVGIAWLLSLLAAFSAGWAWKGDKAEVRETRTELKQAKAETKAVEQARSVERQQNERLHEIGTQYEAKRSENESLPSTVVAQLNDGTLQLRKQWAACETSRLSDATAAAIERDALAELRRKDQGDLVRAGRGADDQIRACQAVVIEDRR
ncbi:hypothetical protein [Stenotrophomonas sp. UBA7606]|uniref:hypothetical protein n=1 Tax=Stenotrophomonas sp. UBA7606 TaxID=1947559 RepID=UPI0025DF1AAE|nr:hypothetical protein [Stenotrophomonas sp. UBA7606]